MMNIQTFLRNIAQICLGIYYFDTASNKFKTSDCLPKTPVNTCAPSHISFFFLKKQNSPPKLTREIFESETLREHTLRSQTNITRPTQMGPRRISFTDIHMYYFFPSLKRISLHNCTRMIPLIYLKILTVW